MRKDQKGITGLETAIILIAFVIVASVFAYVVLSAGLYASQKTKEAVTSGLGSTMSVLELKGDVIAKMENGVLTEVYLTVGIPAAGSPVDFSTFRKLYAEGGCFVFRCAKYLPHLQLHARRKWLT